MTKAEITRFLILRSIGNFLVLFALYGVIATFGPALYFETQYHYDQLRNIHYQIAINLPIPTVHPSQNAEEANSTPIPTPAFSKLTNSQNVKILIPKSTEFGIVIPKIGANAPVFANVDATNENEFLPILKKGVAHAKGSVFPGMKGNIYLFAHSTDNFWDVGRYNAVFYLLKDMSIGDQIVIFFQNKRYNYTVINTKIVDPTDVSDLVNAQNSASQRLILQTCWPPGTTWKRLLVTAAPQ